MLNQEALHCKYSIVGIFQPVNTIRKVPCFQAFFRKIPALVNQFAVKIEDLNRSRARPSLTSQTQPFIGRVGINGYPVIVSHERNPFDPILENQIVKDQTVFVCLNTIADECKSKKDRIVELYIE